MEQWLTYMFQEDEEANVPWYMASPSASSKLERLFEAAVAGVPNETIANYVGVPWDEIQQLFDDSQPIKRHFDYLRSYGIVKGMRFVNEAAGGHREMNTGISVRRLATDYLVKYAKATADEGADWDLSGLEDDVAEVV